MLGTLFDIIFRRFKKEKREEGQVKDGLREYESVLGMGAFGVIFQVSEGRQIFAMKCIARTSIENRQQYRKQCRLLAGIKHENVAEILGYDEKFFSTQELDLLALGYILLSRTDPYPLIKMEMCGKSLEYWIKTRSQCKNFDETGWNIVEGLLSGLAFLHSENILHRTINPENILFTYCETDPFALPIKIGHSALYCDAFSMSSWDVERQYSEVPYVSPEAEAGRPSFSSDIYSLGLIFWQVLYALNRSQLCSLLYKVVYEKRHDLMSQHPEIVNAKEVIIAMTQRYTKDRVQSTSEIKFIRKLRNHKQIQVQENSAVYINPEHKSKGLSPPVGIAGTNSEWLDQIVLTDILGTGSFGCVLAAKTSETSHNSPTCVKIVFLDSDVHRSQLELCGSEVCRRATVYREYATIAGKAHQNIVCVLNCAEKEYHPNDLLSLLHLEASENNDCLFGIYARVQLNLRRSQSIRTFCIEMERCGGNLRDWLHNHINESQISDEIQRTQVEIVRGLIEGLKYLHSNNIIHRDLKPDNILFAKSFTLPVKIGDFGLARFVSSSLNSSANMTPNFCTTPFYRAPEMEGDEYGKPADLFSLGLVIWEVLQLISRKEFPRMKYSLVHDYDPTQDVDLIQPHSLVLNAKDIIYNLTRLVKSRTQSIDDVVLMTPN